MSANLAPIVAKKIRQFRRRRIMLILTRGFCAGFVAFLLCFAIVSLIDWYWLLTDQTRWYLSGTAYTCVILAVWATCLRRMLHLPAMEEIASQMEMTEPELRENLLSAVELATDDPESLNDSPVFRRLLQGKVAEQMTQVRVRKLLPIHLVAKWILAAIVFLAVASILLTSKDPRFRHLAKRAILPGANLARVSRIQVEVLAPSPHSQTIAEDETVAVEVAISGGNVSEVILETFTEQEGAVQRTMSAQSASEYISNLHVGNESVEYRILAGDAVTKKFLLAAKPRPHVVAFQKTFEFPEYTQLSSEKITDQHGDLLALEGTKVELIVELDQEVSEAELQIDIDKSDEFQTIPLTRVETNESKNSTPWWSAKVSIDQPAIYKVHLVSKETGFENTYSPRYEIRPVADLIPKAGFIDQQETTLLLPPSDILSLQGIAEDDLPLVKLEQQFSINGQDWEAISLPTLPNQEGTGHQLNAKWQWDLLNLDLDAGDQILTKLVATDRKGNLGESVPLRIVVAAQDFDPDRHQLMQKKSALYDELKDYEELLAEQKSTALEVLEKLRSTSPADQSVKIDQDILLDLAKKQQEQAAYLLAKIKDVVQEMPPGADSYDLDLIGKVMSRLQREHTSTPTYLIHLLHFEAEEKARKKIFDQLKRSFEKTADDAKHIAQHYQQLIAQNFINSIAYDLSAILEQQRLISESPTQTWDRLHRQETIVLNQLDVLEDVIHNQFARMPSSLSRHFTGLLRWSENYRQRFEDSMESEDQLTTLQKTSQSFYQEIQNKQHYNNIDGGLANRVLSARRDLDNRAGNLYVPIEHLSRAVQQEHEITTKAVNSEDSEESKNLLSEAEHFIAEIDLKLLPTLDQLRDRRALTQVRTDADSQYAADTGLTSRAIQYLLNQHRSVSPEDFMLHDALREITFAFRILEAGHEFASARIAVDHFSNSEQWNSQKLQGRFEHPRQWEYIGKAFELASQRLREARVERQLVDKLDQIRWSPAMRDANRKINERRWRKEEVTGAAHEVVEIRQRLSVLDAELQPAMAEARQIISKYAPTIPQMALQAAEQVRELEVETTQSADNIEKPETSQQVQESQLTSLEKQQEQINQQLEDLMEALVEDANTQDLLREEERERARDADDSIALIEEPAKAMNRELQEAANSETQEQQAQNLSEAAEEQEKTAQALDLIAEHFDRLDQDLDVADSRNELRQSERELGISRQMDQRYEESQKLEQQANQNAEDLLTELTEELKQNPAMQQALSEISMNTLEDAQNTLEFAAQDDQNLQRANERSDSEFQAKKKELSENLRQMGAQASRLSRGLLAQANYAANKGEAEEAQKKIGEAQKNLNDVASAVNSVRDDQLLSDLATAAASAEEKLNQALQELKEAEKLTEKSKNESIHEDEKSRQNQKKDFERRNQQLHEQQKREARDVVRAMENTKRQADSRVRNAENQVRNFERQKKQAESNLKRKPEDAGLQRNLERAEERLQVEKQKLEREKQTQNDAEVAVKSAKQKADQINRKKRPPLNAQNPAGELADLLTEEGIQETEELQQLAQQLAQSSQFGEELTPSRDELANSERFQKEVTKDVQQASDDVARASRHEDRLQNSSAAETLKELADSIDQIAQNESMDAEQQLAEAVTEAEKAEDQSSQKPGQNTQGLQAQSALAETEAALNQQAEQLASAMQPLQSENQNSDQQPASENSAPATPEATPSSVNPASQQSSDGQPAFTPEEIAHGEQLARTLDELDRQMAAAATQTGETPTSPAQLEPLNTLAQAAKAQQAQIATARAQQQQSTAIAMSEGDSESEGEPPATGPVTDFNVTLVNRTENRDWGKLRNKKADDLSKGQTLTVSDEYRKKVDTYFRVLSERSRKR